MQILTVSLFGDSELAVRHVPKMEKALEKTVRRLLEENEFVDFLMGRSSDFALLAPAIIRSCRRETGRNCCALTLVLPYETADDRHQSIYYENRYDRIEIETEPMRHSQAACQLCSQSMVDRSDVVIAAVERANGDAYQTMQYALSRGRTVINLFDKSNDRRRQ